MKRTVKVYLEQKMLSFVWICKKFNSTGNIYMRLKETVFSAHGKINSINFQFHRWSSNSMEKFTMKLMLCWFIPWVWIIVHRMRLISCKNYLFIIQTTRKNPKYVIESSSFQNKQKFLVERSWLHAKLYDIRTVLYRQ